MKRIAIYGGSFNPPHVSHLLTAITVKAIGNVDEVWVTPSLQHPEGKVLTPFDERMALCRAMVDGVSGIKVSSLERESPTSYTVDLLRTAREHYPDVQWSFVMGADLIDQFPRWRNPEQIVKLASLIILGRQGVPPPVAPIPENSRLLIDVCLPSMSSTAIRARLARGEDVSDLVPAPVLAQIRLLGMYEPDPQ